MAIQEFIRNVRSARNLLDHRVNANHPGVDAGEAASRSSRAAPWLTPASVQGFDAAHFPELPDASREELERNVRAFREVAEQVPADGPATAEQEAAAARSFRDILRILDPYLPAFDELDRLRTAMKAVNFPDVVETWDYEFGRDSSGDPAVWIWVVVDEVAADDPTFTATTIRLRRDIHQSLQRAGLGHWPYVRFRTIAEQRSLQAVGQ